MVPEHSARLFKIIAAVGEWGQVEVFLGDDGFGDGDLPVDVQFGVVKADATFTFLVVKSITFIRYFRCFAEDGETVGEAAGYEQLAAVVRGQFDADPFPIGRGAFAKVDGYVEDLSPEHADQFALGIGVQLIVQAADDAIGGKGLVVLDKTIGGAFLMEGLLIIGFKKVPALVFIDDGFEDE